MAACGCNGGGRLDLISLDYGAIDPPAAKPTRVTIDECYWWTDEAGRLWIALAVHRGLPLVPASHVHFCLTLRLDAPPAGKARDYRVGRDELRGVARLAGLQSRFTSAIGIVAVYREGGERLRGALRVQTSRETATLLGAWSRPSRVLLLGEFSAVRDAGRGRRIADQTESDGWQHDESPASRPVAAERGR